MEHIPGTRHHRFTTAVVERFGILAPARAAAPVSPWMNADEAAAYLRCPVSRIRKLTMSAELPVHRDGRRVLFHRDELDDYVRNGGAICP